MKTYRSVHEFNYDKCVCEILLEQCRLMYWHRESRIVNNNTGHLNEGRDKSIAVPLNGGGAFQNDDLSSENKIIPNPYLPHITRFINIFIRVE